MRKMEMKTRNYTAPTVKVVTFMVEHGFAGSDFEVRSLEVQTLESQGDGNELGQAEGLFRRQLGGSN